MSKSHSQEGAEFESEAGLPVFKIFPLYVFTTGRGPKINSCLLLLLADEDTEVQVVPRLDESQKKCFL